MHVFINRMFWCVVLLWFLTHCLYFNSPTASLTKIYIKSTLQKILRIYIHCPILYHVMGFYQWACLKINQWVIMQDVLQTVYVYLLFKATIYLFVAMVDCWIASKTSNSFAFIQKSVLLILWIHHQCSLWKHNISEQRCR